MSGALHRTLRGRRRFDAGGAVDDLPIPPIPPDGGALAQGVTSDRQPVSSGALAQGIQQPGNDDTPATGALGRPADADRASKLASLQTAINTLQAGGAGGGLSPMLASLQARGSGSAPGSTNLPLLAAAGALLSPTRSGNFGESLGNAMTSGAKVAEEERQRIENAALRLQQAQWNNDYRQQMASAATTRANAYAGPRTDILAQSADDRRALAEERLATARAAHETAAAKGSWQAGAGLDENGQQVPGSYFFPTGGGDPQFHPGVVQQKTVDATNTTAFRNRIADLKAQGLDEKTAHDQATADLGAGRLGVQQQNAGTAATRAANTQTNQAASLDLRRQAFAALVQQRGIQNNAAAQRDAEAQVNRMSQQELQFILGTKDPMTGKPQTTPEQADTTVKGIRDKVAAGQPSGGARPAPTTSADPLAAARDAIARGAPRDKVIQRLQQNGIDPTGL